jgi:stress response protein SCP2
MSAFKILRKQYKQPQTTNTHTMQSNIIPLTEDIPLQETTTCEITVKINLHDDIEEEQNNNTTTIPNTTNNRKYQFTLHTILLTSSGHMVDPCYYQHATSSVAESSDKNVEENEILNMSLKLNQLPDSIKVLALALECGDGLDLGNINSMTCSISDELNQISYLLEDDTCNYMDIIKGETGYIIAMFYRPDNYRPNSWRVLPVSQSMSVFSDIDLLMERVPDLSQLFHSTRGVPVIGLLKGEFFKLPETNSIRVSAGWIIKKDHQTSKLVNIAIAPFDKEGKRIADYPLLVSSSESNFLDGAIQIKHHYKELEKCSSPRRQKFEDGEHEYIDIELNRLPETIHSFIICLSANTANDSFNLKLVQNLRTRITDLQTEEEICKLSHTDPMDKVGAYITCRIYRSENRWKVKAINRAIDGDLDTVYEQLFKKKVMSHIVIPAASATFDINVPEAKDLLGKDRNGLSDPYVKLYVNGKKSKSRVVRKCLNPKWDNVRHFKSFETLDKLSTPPVVSVHAALWDKDQLKSDDFLGQVAFELTMDGTPIHKDEWMTLEKRGPNDTEEVGGSVRVIYNIQYSSRLDTIESPIMTCDPFYSDRLLFEL